LSRATAAMTFFGNDIPSAGLVGDRARSNNGSQGCRKV
jgi:hypothetical protein